MKDSELPGYVAFNNESVDLQLRKNLKIPSQAFSFPLSESDLQIINTIEAKFDQEENMAGLAAPQIGFHKQAIIFAVPDEPKLKKWREDLTDTMPKTIWLNPSYEAIGDDVTTDYEACFSVDDLVGPVTRATNIQYVAYDKNGMKISGTASGFLSRVIQHEIDHVQGKLFIDMVPQDMIQSMDSYRIKRAQKMHEKESSSQ
ncbi:MAG: peptide deformylase [Francisellaceae bacterium]|nr:peptide deformylase [Francisellaceae bacterium]MBT6207826.1 peptide deformylase [Francisellaceae bacterium]MBT6538844.1 peptide deformylase [Francisellaceae bacterium]